MTRTKIPTSPLTVFGETMSKRKAYEYLKYMPNFISNHARAIRHAMGEFAKLDEDLISTAVASAFDPSLTPKRRADYAYTVVAWYKFFDPFFHKKRHFKLDINRFIPLIYENPVALLDYARFVDGEPKVETYNKLKNQHPAKAEDYHTYCEFVTVARANDIELQWLRLW